MKTRITIRGKSYTLRSDQAEEDLPAVAREVDRRVQDILGRSPGLDEYTAALLTCLNLASDLARLRREVDLELEGLDREVASSIAMLEALSGDDPTDDGEGE